MIEVTKTNVILIVILMLLVISNILVYDYYNAQVEEMAEERSQLLQEKSDISHAYQELWKDVFYFAECNSTASTVVYYTNFSRNQRILSFSIPYEKYDACHKTVHPYWGIADLESADEYITTSETIIIQIVETIRNQTHTEEEFADALLDFVQDKGHGLSIRYYPTTELKYPIETLVEMGGDCDTHAFLYATLMKAAGFKVLLLYSEEVLDDGQYHVATAVNLMNPPENSLPNYPDSDFTYNGEKYYFAETTLASWRVGDLPTDFEGISFHLVPV